SVTKQFTATAILMLQEEGKLKVSDEITQYLPGYPTQGKKITIEHLLTHTSGIPGYTGKPSFMQHVAEDLTFAQMIEGFKDDPLHFDPGTDWNYSNAGYFLLGAIIEKVSGMAYADFIAQRIFVPLHMDHSAYEGHARASYLQARGYTADTKGFVPCMVGSM